MQARSFEELLDKAIKAYTNKSIEAAEIVQWLIELAKKMQKEQQRGTQLNLSEEEIAFYDALADNESAVEVLGDKTLHLMAKELVDTVRKNVTVDWTLRDNVQAKLRVLVKRLLKKYKYPPDMQQKATDTFLDQAKYSVKIGLKLARVSLTKKQRKREIMKADVKRAKQSTLEDLSFQFDINRSKEVTTPTKTILINRITDVTKEDELELKVEFTLLPSKASFSKINFDLYFHEQLLNSTPLCIPQSSLLNDSFEYSLILDMKGIPEGSYLFRVEMYELWSSGEKLNFTAKEVVVQYVPQTRESRLVKIPTVKSDVGAGLTVVSSAAKTIYREIEDDLKKEATSKKDEW